MKKIIALGGSNSKNSINKTFATYVANQVNDAEVIVADLNDFSTPSYGIDHETAHGIPEGVTRLHDLIDSVDGLVVSLAEHNGAYSAAFKSTYDWLSRINPKVWKNKPMLLMATSPGGRGGKSVLEIAKGSFPRLGGNIIADFSLPSFNDNFLETGIKDETLQTELNDKIKLFEAAL